MKTWIRPQPQRFSAGELMRRAGVGRVGRYDRERLEPGPLFHDACGYLWALHDNADARSVLPFGCPPDDTTAQLRWGH